MSISVGGYGQGYVHPGPLAHDFYAQYHQPRYTDQGDGTYISNWMMASRQDMSLSPGGSPYAMVNPGSPGEYTQHISYDTVDGQIRMRCVKRRVTANKKERRRTQSINTAFASLRGCIPNVPNDTKLSKIKTLRLATSYISYLMEVLSKDDPKLAEAGFKAELAKRSDKKKEEQVSCIFL